MIFSRTSFWPKHFGKFNFRGSTTFRAVGQANEVIGVLQCINKLPQRGVPLEVVDGEVQHLEFNDEDLSLLETFSNLVVPAIENYVEWDDAKVSAASLMTPLIAFLTLRSSVATPR